MTTTDGRLLRRIALTHRDYGLIGATPTHRRSVMAGQRRAAARRRRWRRGDTGGGQTAAASVCGKSVGYPRKTQS